MKNFRLIIFFTFLLQIKCLFAQDFICKNDNSIIKAKVIEITLESIVYRPESNANVNQTIPLKEVFAIVYGDGTTEIINKTNNKIKEETDFRTQINNSTPYGIFFYNSWSDLNNNGQYDLNEFTGLNKSSYDIYCTEDLRVGFNFPEQYGKVIIQSMKLNRNLIGVTSHYYQQIGRNWTGPISNITQFDYLDMIQLNGKGEYIIKVTFETGASYEKNLVITKGNCHKIQDLINNAQNGSTITIPPGVYSETNILVYNKKSLKIIANNVVIKSDDGNSLIFDLINCNDVFVQGLKVYHEVNYCAAGCIKIINSEKITLTACDISGSGAIGVTLRNSSNINITNSSIYKCSYSGVLIDDYQTSNHNTMIKLKNIKFFENERNIMFSLQNNNKIELEFENSIIKIDETNKKEFKDNKYEDYKIF